MLAPSKLTGVASAFWILRIRDKVGMRTTARNGHFRVVVPLLNAVFGVWP